jgi:predicted amidophosphoribosyltransferase
VPLDGFAVEAAGPYTGALRRAILSFKGGRRDVGDALGALLVARFAATLPRGALLVPIPTLGLRRRERGFDQSVRLARALGAGSGLPVVQALRQIAGDAQRGRTREARLRARGRFACDCPGLMGGTTVVLVDDVLTTGATLGDAALALAACDAVVCHALVVAAA